MMLKSSGYDHVVITGAAIRPVYIKICNDEVSLEDARGLWRKDIFDTASLLSRQYRPCSTISIGPAGENRVSISLAYVDLNGHLGSGGLGAVMGSKNLKAIVACRGNRPVNVADASGLRQLAGGILDRMKRSSQLSSISRGGSMVTNMVQWLEEPRILGGGVRAQFPDAHEKAAIRAFVDKYKKTYRPMGCPRCLSPCKGSIEVESGEYAGTVCFGNFFAPFPGGGDIYGCTLKYFADLNRYGICVFEFSSLLHLISFLQENGLVQENEVGFRVTTGDLEVALRLIEMTAYRRGFGDVLAGGVKEFVRRVPQASDHAAHIKGRSIPFMNGWTWDPRVRGLGNMEFTQMTNPRGAHLSTSGAGTPQPGLSPQEVGACAKRIGIPDEAIPRVLNEAGVRIARLNRYTEDWVSLLDCVGICAQPFIETFYGVDMISELYRALSGREVGPRDMMRIAERSWNLWRLLNVKQGFSRKDDHPPDTWFTPLKSASRELALHDYHNTRILNQEDITNLLDEYYDERGWNPDTGAPSPGKLEELSLGDYARNSLQETCLRTLSNSS